MRRLADFPEWSWQRDAMATWPDRFQRYFNDRFAFRNALIRLQAAVLWHGLHTSSTDTVIAGKGDWLFYADDGGIQDYVQAETLHARQSCGSGSVTLERTRDWLASRGTRFLFVLAPDKQMIYPELMPTSLHRLHDSLPRRPAPRLHAGTLHRRDPGPAAGHPRGQAARTAVSPLRHALERPRCADRLPADRDAPPAVVSDHPSRCNARDFITSPTAPSGDKTTMLGLVDDGKVTMPGLVPRRGWSSVVVFPEHPDPYGEDGTVVTEVRARNRAASGDVPRLVREPADPVPVRALQPDPVSVAERLRSRTSCAASIRTS